MVFRTSTVQSFEVEMFDVITNKKIDQFESLAKAARFCGYYNRSSTFNTKVYKKEIMEIMYKGEKRNVYFKIKN